MRPGIPPRRPPARSSAARTARVRRAGDAPIDRTSIAAAHRLIASVHPTHAGDRSRWRDLGLGRSRSRSSSSSSSTPARSRRAAPSRTSCCATAGRGRRRRLGRQSRRGGRFCGEAARHAGDDLRARRRVAGEVQRIRDYGAELVVGGERYADALAASEAWAAESGALPSTPTTRPRRCSARARSASSSKRRRPSSTRCWSRSAAAGYRRHRRVVRGRASDRRRRAGGRADAHARARRRPSGRRPGRRHRRRLARSAPGRRADVPDRAGARERVALVTDDAIRAAQVRSGSALRIVAEPGGAAAFAALLRAGMGRAQASAWASSCAAGTRRRSISTR